MGRLSELQQEINDLRKTLVDKDQEIAELKKSASRTRVSTSASTTGTGSTTGLATPAE